MSESIQQRGGSANGAAEQAAERVYQEWDDALGRKDVSDCIELYTPDCTLESPLVRNLLGSERGVVQGIDNLRDFVTVVFERTPDSRKRYRTGFFTDGRTITWEYPRVTPDGEQMDLVEVMELKDGLIHQHRVYWGWSGVDVLTRDAYRR
jgi:hypothetical protein